MNLIQNINKKIFSDNGKKVASSHGLKRSSHWATVEKHFLEKNPVCVACAEKTFLHGIFAHQVHHIFPFHYAVLLGRPDLETDFRNLITLCQVPQFQHHLLLGHLGDFHSYNPDVIKFVTDYRGLVKEDIVKSEFYKKTLEQKPKPFDLLTTQEKEEMLNKLNIDFPLSGRISCI